jgi:hypothetical protein
MSLIVIGGHARGVGKTSVVAALISALPECRWMAMKISQHGHGMRAGSRDWAISEEQDWTGNSDTSRFLAAGAARAFWVRTAPRCLAAAIPAVREKLAGSQNAIVESNSIVKFLHPDIYLAVIDPATLDFKHSAQEFLPRADAVILRQNHAEESARLEILATQRVFHISPPEYVTPEIVEFVKAKLRKA